MACEALNREFPLKRVCVLEKKRHVSVPIKAEQPLIHYQQALYGCFMSALVELCVRYSCLAKNRKHSKKKSMQLIKKYLFAVHKIHNNNINANLQSKIRRINSVFHTKKKEKIPSNQFSFSFVSFK